MNQIPTKQIIEEHLVRVLKSPQFSSSKRYSQLLSFLVGELENKNHLKETFIGNEIFGKEYNPIKDDGKVRVYMYNLRKRLSAYYDENNLDDSIYFYFEHGNYRLKVKIKEQTESIVASSKFKLYQWYWISLISLTVLLSILIVSKKEVYCWTPFFEKQSNTSCILADQVILTKTNRTPGEIVIVREVNSVNDFIAYTKNHKIDSLKIANYSYFTKAIPQGIHILSRWFFENNSDFKTVGESELRYDETKQANILYIGQQKTMSMSEEIFLRNSIKFKTDGDFFVLTASNKVLYPKFKNGIVRSEYAVVSYFPLTETTSALYFVSNHDIGTMATIQKFTNLDFLKEFYTQLPSDDSYFNALFEVEGLERTDVSCELVELEVISQ